MKIRRLASLAGVLAGAWLAAAPALAQEEMPARVRGTLVEVKGDTLVVETPAGEVLGFRLKDGAGIFTVTPATLEDVQAGDYVGLTTVNAGGRQVALGAHVFPDDMRGTAEGQHAWDLVREPNVMTNATVAEVTAVGSDRELKVSWPGGEETVTLSPNVPIVRMQKAQGGAVLEPGREVFVMVEAPPDGLPEAVAVVVGDQGAKPPM